MSERVKHIAELGVIAIVLESLEIFWTNARVLIPVQLALGLPAVVLSVALQFVQAFYRPAAVRASSGPASVEVSLVDSLKVTFYTNRISLSHSLIMIIMESLALQAVDALAVSANIYAIGLVYTEGTLSFVEVVKAALRSAWLRLVVTLFYLQVVLISTLLFCVGFIFLIVHLELDPSWISIPSVLLLGVIIHVTLISMVASGVSVLEEDYGWSAISKSRKLLRGKRTVAFLFQLLLFVLVTITTWPAGRNIARFRRDPRNPMPYILTVPYIIWNTFFSQITALAMGVAFASFKARHGESIVSSYLLDDLTGEERCPLEEVLIEEIEYPSIEKESKEIVPLVHDVCNINSTLSFPQDCN